MAESYFVRQRMDAYISVSRLASRSRWLWVLMLLLCCTEAVAAVRSPFYTVTGWDMDDGLPHNLVHAVAQADDGMIWVGTWEGAARFNGRTFTTYDRQTSPGMELGGIYVVQRDGDDAMLFGTAYAGVYRMQRGNWQQLGDARARRLQATAVLRDPDGSVWVGTPNNLYRIVADGSLVEVGVSAGLPVARVTTLLHDDDGRLLVGTDVGIFRMDKDGSVQPWSRASELQGIAVRKLVRDREGGFLAATNNGVWWWHRDGRLQRLRTGERVAAVLQDRRGRLWMNLYTGVLAVHRGIDQDDQIIPIDGVVSPGLMEDEEGLIWVGTSHGLFRVAEGVAYGLSMADGLDSNYVRSVMQTDDGAVWIGHIAGLARWQDGRIKQVPLMLPTSVPANPSVLSLAADAGNGVWVGTHDAGVLHIDANGKVDSHIGIAEGLPSRSIRALLADPDGGLWIGTKTGLAYRRAGHTRVYGEEDGVAPQSVQVLYRDRRGSLWIGGNNGMQALDPDGNVRRWTHGEDFPAQNVFDFLGDADGVLWIATDQGLLRLRDGKLRVYDHRHGLPRDKLFRILDDGSGYLWLSSNHGVFRIARAEFDAVDAQRRTQLAVDVVDRSDGMPGNQGNGSSSPAGWRTQSGDLLFPTSEGLGVISPVRVKRGNKRQVAVVVERVVANGIVQAQQEGHQFGADIRRIVIGYAGLNFAAPDKVRYRYRLVGFDPHWIEAGSSTEAVYTNLSPGSYRFQVQAMSLPVDWEVEERIGSSDLVLALAPPWWRRAEFIVIEVLLLAAALYLIFLWRTSSYRRRQHQLNALIAERTHELSEKNRALLNADREREQLVQKLEYQATHDVLTGLPNRREAERYLETVMEQSQAKQQALALALVDIDHFKSINDNYGHETGDEVLRRIGSICAGSCDRGVFSARLGGEEFLLVVAGRDEVKARHIFERIRMEIGAITVMAGTTAIRCTASMGMQMLVAGISGRRELMVRADHRLYLAKRGGRDRLVCSDDGQ